MSYIAKPTEPPKVIEQYKLIYTENHVSFGDYVKIPDGVTHVEVEDDYGDKHFNFYLVSATPNPNYEKQFSNYQQALHDYHIKKHEEEIKEARQKIESRRKLYEELKKEFGG